MKMKSISKKISLIIVMVFCFNMIVAPVSAAEGYKEVKVKTFEYVIANDNLVISLGQNDGDFLTNVKSIKEKVTKNGNITNVIRKYTLKDGSKVTDIITITENDEAYNNSSDSIKPLSTGDYLGSVTASISRVEPMGTATLRASFEWQTSDEYPLDDNRVWCYMASGTPVVTKSGWTYGESSVETSDGWVYYGSAYARFNYEFKTNTNPALFYQSSLEIWCSDNGSVS